LPFGITDPGGSSSAHEAPVHPFPGLRPFTRTLHPRSSPWADRLALGAYSALYATTLPALVPLLAAHPRLRGHLGERLGRAAAPAHAIWLHGSSAGDLAALLPLASRLGQRWPVLLSAWTSSGRELARRRLPGSAAVAHAPLDLALVVRPLLRRLLPRLVALECLEIWPRLVRSCHALGVPVAVVNGRLTPRSLRWYRAASALFRPCFAHLALVVALTDADAERFVAAGARAERVFVAPSTKHDGLIVQPAAPEPKLVLGSIHRAEERLLIPWVRRALSDDPRLRVVIAPRYPHRAPAVQRRLARLGVPSRRSSEGEPSRVCVLDEVGRLAGEYAGARVALVGGSLVARGGHNLIEAAARGVPVLFGPYVDNCRGEAALLQEAGAGAVVTDGAAFWARSRELLADDAAFFAAREAALRVATQLAGSAGRVADRLSALAEGAG
jgi:3-deoxy-D-manno-octulosonic-acid transferase